MIFFQMKMQQAIPVSTIIGNVTTLLRFIINYNQKHPKDYKRVIINYEVIDIVLPFLFLGSFFGVLIGQQIGNIA